MRGTSTHDSLKKKSLGINPAKEVKQLYNKHCKAQTKSLKRVLEDGRISMFVGVVKMPAS